MGVPILSQQGKRGVGQDRGEVIRGQVGVAHGHLDIAVAQDALQGEDVAALHHVVAGEGVSQDVGQLAGVWRPVRS